MALHGLVLDLVVREDRLRGRVPVDQALAAIDQAVLEQIEEVGSDGLRANLVHREPRAFPVARAAHRLELAQDRGFVLVLPRLDAFDELLPLEIGAPPAFLREDALLDDGLRRDARVVRAGHPERLALLHPSEADQNVLERVVQGVSQVQCGGHVRRGDHNGERSSRAAVTRRLGVKVGSRLPELSDLLLDGLRIVCL